MNGYQGYGAPPAPALFTIQFACRTCGKVLGHCYGVSHAQLQNAAEQGSRSFGCDQPGHVFNANLTQNVIPYQPPVEPLPPMVPAGQPSAVQPAQVSGQVIGQVAFPKGATSEEAPVDPTADAILKQAVRDQSDAIATRGSNAGISGIAQARQHAPVTDEKPFNGTIQSGQS